MAKKNIKTLGRKALSLLLTLTMVTSMLQLPAMAASYEDQTMDGYYIINENGNQGLAEAGVESVTEDGYTLTKTIEQTGENAFDITLSVETSQTVTTNDAAIQLVIDLSNSMNYCADCGAESCSHKAGTRIAAVKNAIAGQGGFLDTLATNNTGSLYVSVIFFGSKAGVIHEWTDINAEGGLSAVKNAVNGMTLPGGDDGGTNLEAGLMLADNRWGMEEVQSVSSKYTVLLSDGEPTFRCKDDHSSTTSITEYTYDSNNRAASEAERNEAVAEANNIKEKSSLYSVCFGVSGESFYEKDLCSRCGQMKEDHTKYGNTYYCKNSNWQKFSATVVTVGDYLANEIATASTYAFNANNTASLNAAFLNIAQSAVNGMSGAGTAVTDPMGQYIVLGDVSALAAEGVTAEGNAISWALDPANAETTVDGDTTTYKYSITYPITLDTSVEGFEEDVYHPANGHTFLGVPQADGSVKKISFLVPGVCGWIPEYDWTVEYYLQDESSINADAPTYTLDDTDDMGVAKLHSSVNAPDGYESKYERKNYTFANGETVLKITADPEQNVIRLYYDLITAPVTEKHYYKTTTITPAGETIVGEYVEDPDKTTTVLAVVDSEYEAAEQPIFGGVSYEFDEANPRNKTVTVTKNGNNLVELFYSRTDDQRVETNAQVDHVYTLYTYELNEDGKYELTAQDPVKEEKVQYSEKLRATTVYNVSDAPKSGYEDYELNPELGDYADLVQADGSLSFVLKDAAEDNIRTLYFEQVVDKREAIEVTVEHYYTKNITAIEDGVVVNYNDPDNVLGLSESFDAYVGESFTAAEENDYQGETYISDDGNAAKLHIDALTGNVTIQLYYDLTEAPEKASVIANHYWRTYTDVTVELTESVVDEETGETTTVVIGTDIETRERIDHKIEGIEYTDLYVGQKHIEAQQAWGEGYTFNAQESLVEVIAGEGEEANLYYDRWAEDDERREADITVHHIYTTHLTTVVDGEVKTLTIKEGPVEESYTELKAGDEFVAVAQPVYNENEYTQITAEEDLSVILQPGTNATIVIHYEREASDLVDADYSVDYEYRTYTMTINEAGEAGYWTAPEVSTDADGGAGYVGQKVVLDAKAIEGFNALPTNPGTVQILKDGENHWTFVYEKYIPLAEGSVVVNHHYKTITITVNGTSSEATQSVYGTPVVKYIGEAYTAEAILNGFAQTGVTVDAAAVELAESVSVTVGQATVIDFYYEKTEDFSVPVTYTIAHEYYLYDWDGSLISESKPAPVSGTGFATNPLVVAPEPTDYDLVSATYNGVEMESYTITLQDGPNDVLFVYEKTLPRDFVDATVIHNYYKDEAAMLAEIPAPEAQYTAVSYNLPESSEFAAEIRDLEGYAFHSAAPESMSIIVTEDGENLIVLNYVRKAAEYEVVHVYYGNGEFEGSTSESFGGLHGDVITADSIARVPEYAGNVYNFVSVSEDIVLDSNEKKTIELVYERTFVVLVPTDYSVDHEYRTYKMTVNESGVAGYHTAPEIITDGYSRDGYVGEAVELDPRAIDGYTALPGNPGVNQILSDGGNHWSFVYERYLPLSSGSVVVNHHYKTITIAENGTSSEATESVLGDIISKRIGETYTAAAVPNGFVQTGAAVDGAAVENKASVTVTVGEKTVIDFYYEKTVDNSVTVPYSIAHEYFLYDWDGTLISESKPAPITGSGFVTTSVTAEAQPNGYELVDARYNGAELSAPYTIALAYGENNIVFTYEKVLARDNDDVIVIHEYYETIESEEPEKVVEEIIPDQPEGSEYIAEPKEEDGYEFHSADPGLTIEVEDGGENIIVIKYIRKEAAYKVIHVYNCNGVEEGRTSERFTGLHGDVVDADSIERVPAHNGRGYRFVSVTGDIVLDADAEKSIILIYNRTTGDGRDPDPKPDPDPDPIEIPEEPVPLTPAPSDGDGLEEILDEEVPLAAVPKTGDESIKFILMALASAMGLAGLSFSKKREEEME